MNKKLGFFVFLFCLTVPQLLLSQSFTYGGTAVSSSNSGLSLSLSNIDEVFFFDGSTSASITFNNTENATYEWYAYTSSPSSATKVPESSSSGAYSSELSGQYTTLENPEHATGYILLINKGLSNEQRKYIWVLNSKEWQARIYSINVEEGDDKCTSLQVNASVRLSSLFYYDKSGKKVMIPRIFTLKWNTLSWNGESYDTKEVTQTQTSTAEGDVSLSFTVDAPYVNTTFTLTGDQIMTLLGTNVSLASDEYMAIAVTQNVVGTVIERDALNEKDRSSTSPLGGSAPLYVQLKSNANTPAAKYFEWYILSQEDSTESAYYTDEDLRYTFKKTGLYTVKLVTSNNYCSTDSLTEDSLIVSVGESYLDIPNVFTPNGDGIDDEFRVAYKSLTSFNAVVYDRWGRKMYEWSDPGKGWNGKCNGKMCVPGAYYYIIEATGADYKNGKRVKYHKAGDINLLRGK